MYSITNPNFFVSFLPINYTINGSRITFNVTLNSGRYRFKLFNNNAGWYDTTDVFLDIARTNTTTYSLDQVTTQVSFNGGAVKINGDNIGDGATITVNGFKGSVIDRTPTYAIFRVPQLVVPASQTDFKLTKEQKIDLTNAAIFGDSAGF